MHKEDLENKAQNDEQIQAEQNSQEMDNSSEGQATEQSQEDLIIRERDEWKDKYLRLYAEFDNYKKRTLREKKEWFREAKSDVISELLPVLDDFDRAKVANEDNNDVDALKEGFNLIHHKLFHALENKGLKAMNSMHQAFDTDMHEAITNIPAPSEDLKGKVVDVVEKGYTMNDHIVRYAKVVVGQ